MYHGSDVKKNYFVKYVNTILLTNNQEYAKI